MVGVTLGFFGGGGSILTVPLLVYVFGLGPKEAIASSLLVVAVASVAGAVQHARAGNADVRTGLIFGGAGMAGAYLGGRASAYVDGSVLILLFATMMVITSLAMWRGRAAPPTGADPGPREVAKLMAQGLAVGSFTGLVGAGGGFLIVPALVLWAGLPMRIAVGTSLVIVVLNTLAGFAGYAAHVRVDLALVSVVAACAVAGSFAGAALSRVVAPMRVRKAFAGFVLAMAGVILVREGALVARATSEALPTSMPQLVFAAIMLGVGVYAGRVSRGPDDSRPSEVPYERGAGI